MVGGLFYSVLFYYWNTLPLEYLTTGYFFIAKGFSIVLTCLL